MIEVVGSYNVDFILKVKRFPQPGETVFCEKYIISHGGKGSNQAVSASRLGANVSLVSAIGNDTYGIDAIKFWKSENINIDKVKIKNERTGNAYIFLNDEGESMIIVNRGANYLLEEDDLDDLSGDILLTQMEIKENVVKRALMNFDGTKILNPAPAILTDFSILDYVDILTPNEIEFKQLTNSDDLEYGLDLLLKKVKKAVIVTLGERGALIATKGKKVLISAPKVPVIDATGAGDVFNSALAYYLEKNKDLEDAVSLATKIASFSVTQIGALGPRWEEVKSFVEEEKF
ncbi:ribokinase [Acidianus brierleyi]|uniref:Ribokinase n=1 Tax=Acidianus brierleyi TaxID=41673 RepID=A0A2U9IE06_9CREN|nr:ribokinase [Acidianus brierleyi]AWR94271.1 ribokinase [Acidianus brierleyi]